MMNGVRHGTEFPEQNQLKSGCQDCFAIVGGYSYNTHHARSPVLRRSGGNDSVPILNTAAV